MAQRKYASGNELIKGLVILADFIIMNLLLYIAARYFTELYPSYLRVAPRIAFIMANISMVISQSTIGIIIHRRRATLDEVFIQVMKLCGLQSAIMFLCVRIIGDSGGMFKFMVIFTIVEIFVIACSRIIERGIIRMSRQAGRNTRSVIFIGSDPAILMLYRNLISDSSTGYKVLGYYADEQMENCPASIKYLGTIDEFNIMAEEYSAPSYGENIDATKPKELKISKIDEVFCSLSHDENKQIVRVMKFCDKNIIHFYYVPRMEGNFMLNLQPEQLGETMVLTNHYEPLSLPFNQFVKRTFDIVMSLIVCIIMLPFLPIIAYFIKRQSPGPLFFKQERTGLNGKTFICLKFRSMHVNSQADTMQATENDPRKFPFGNFLRKTNIDEFPQFYNVLKGDMSIVGPRPHMLTHTEQYGTIIDKYMVRHFSRPGITGYAQVSGSRGETKELWQMEERIQKDIWYIENWTFWLDIKIILKTAITIFIPDKKAY